jgi:hypothetical protein
MHSQPRAYFSLPTAGLETAGFIHLYNGDLQISFRWPWWERGCDMLSGCCQNWMLAVQSKWNQIFFVQSGYQGLVVHLFFRNVSKHWAGRGCDAWNVSSNTLGKTFSVCVVDSMGYFSIRTLHKLCVKLVQHEVRTCSLGVFSRRISWLVLFLILDFQWNRNLDPCLGTLVIKKCSKWSREGKLFWSILWYVLLGDYPAVSATTWCWPASTCQTDISVV